MKNLIFVKLLFVAAIFTLVSCEKDMPYKSTQTAMADTTTKVELRTEIITLADAISSMIEQFRIGWFIVVEPVIGIIESGELTDVTENSITFTVVTEDFTGEIGLGLKNHETGDIMYQTINPGETNTITFSFTGIATVEDIYVGSIENVEDISTGVIATVEDIYVGSMDSFTGVTVEDILNGGVEYGLILIFIS